MKLKMNERGLLERFKQSVQGNERKEKFNN